MVKGLETKPFVGGSGQVYSAVERTEGSLHISEEWLPRRGSRPVAQRVGPDPVGQNYREGDSS